MGVHRGNEGSLGAHIALLTVGLIYGGNYIIAKGLIPDIIGPSAFIVLRVVGGTILFWIILAILAFRKKNGKRVGIERVKKSDFPRLILCGLTGIAINQLCFFNGLAITSPIHASLIMTVNPIFVLVISAILLNIEITSRKLKGIILGGLGAVTLLIWGSHSSISESGASWEGDVLIMINAISYGIYLVVIKPLMEKYNPFTIIAWVFLFGTVFVIPVGIWTLADINWLAFTPENWQALAYVIVGTTFLAYLLNIYALRLVSPVIVSIYIYVQPLLVVALVSIMAIIGYDSYSTDLTLHTAFCAFLIFLGVWLVSVPKGWLVR